MTCVAPRSSSGAAALASTGWASGSWRQTAGPHAALELWRPFTDSRVSLFAKVDAAGVFGQVQQSFEETIGGVSGVTRQMQNMPTVMLNMQAGIGWTPRDNWRLSAGYTYEHWWDAAFAAGSRGDVWTQGVFVRAEWRY